MECGVVSWNFWRRRFQYPAQEAGGGDASRCGHGRSKRRRGGQRAASIATLGWGVIPGQGFEMSAALRTVRTRIVRAGVGLREPGRQSPRERVWPEEGTRVIVCVRPPLVLGAVSRERSGSLYVGVSCGTAYKPFYAPVSGLQQ